MIRWPLLPVETRLDIWTQSLLQRMMMQDVDCCTPAGIANKIIRIVIIIYIYIYICMNTMESTNTYLG